MTEPIDVLKTLMEVSWRDPDNLEIGEDISDLHEVKIIFDGYGYNEETDEQDNTNLESYAIFIHKDALQPDFEFPPHDLTPFCLIHRPNEEECIYAWYDVLNDSWEFSNIDKTITSDILLGLNDKYFTYKEE